MNEEMPIPEYHGPCDCEECQPELWNEPEPEALSAG